MAWASQGYSDYLMALGRQVQPGVWITGLVVHGDGRDIVLMGRTNDSGMLPAYLQKLGLEERFKGRRFAQFDVTSMGQGEDAERSSGATGGVVQFTLRSVVANDGRSDRPAPVSMQDAVNAVEQQRQQTSQLQQEAQKK
jgi:hypothetical protein